MNINVEEPAEEEVMDTQIDESNDTVEEEEAPQEDVSEDEANSEDEQEDDIISLDEDAPSSGDEEQRKAPEWVKELRKQNKELTKQNKRLQAERDALRTPKEEKLPKKPTLADFDYDEDAHEIALEEWYEKKRIVDAKEAEINALKEQQQQAWQAKIDAYEEGKKRLKYADVKEIEEVVADALTKEQQSVILEVAENPALMIYLLGAEKNEKVLKSLSQEKSLAKFASKIGKLEVKMSNTSPRKPATKPEKTVKSSGGVSSTANERRLKQLEEQAEKSGNYTEYFRARKQLKKG